MSDITVDFAQYTTDTTLNGAYNAGDNVTLADDSSILDGLTDAQIDSLATNNVDTISATDGVLSWTADQYAHLILGPVAIDPDTFAIMADTGADISALTATQIGEIAAKGVAVIDPTDSMLTFSVDQFDALGAMSVDASTDFTIADTGAHLAGMSAGAIAALGSLGVDHLDATDDVLSLNLAQYQALGTVTLTAGDDVTLADTSAHLQTLTASDFGNLGSNGIDHIDATDDVLTISLADFNALGSVTLTQSDVVTLADTGATISGFSTGNIDTLAAGGIDVFDATDNAISFTVAQYNETVTDHIALTAGDTVTLADSGPTLSLLTATEISALVNVDAVDATDNTLVIAVDQFDAFVGKGITLAAGDAVAISDTAANLATLDFSTLAAANVDQLNSTTAFTTLTVANLTALGTVIFSGASSVTLTDAGANIAAVTNFSAFAAHGVDTLDASDNTLTISEAQFQALGTTTLTGADTVTISDTAANIAGAANYATLAAAGVDFLNATTPINITINNFNSLGTVAFTAGSTVTLFDTGAHIALVANFATFASHGVDRIDASDNTLTISATQYGALGAVTLTAADTVTISDTAAHLSGLTFSALAGANVDFLDATNAYTNLTVQNVTDLGTVHFTAASNVTLTDSAANIQAVSDFTTFATHGVDAIKSSDNALSLSVSQFTGLGTTHLTGSDAVTLADTAANLDTYLDTAGTQTALSTNGADTIHATGGSLSVTAAEFSVVHGAGAVFSAGDSVTLADSAANITALDFTTLASTGIDTIDASDNTLNVTVAQYLDVAGAVAFTAADTVTISDTAAHVEALTAGQIGALSTNLIDAVTVTSGGDLDWSVAQWQALSPGVSVSDSGGALVVDDGQATLEGLTGTQLGALAASGAQELASTDGTLNLSVSQAEGFLGTGLSIALGDAGTLSDSGAAIAGLTAAQIGQLAAAGFDTIDASDNTLTLNVAQFSALGTVTLAGGDAVTLADTASNLNTYLHGNVFSALSANDVNTIHATEGAISIDAQVVNNVAGSGAVFASGDTVTLSDTGANIAALNFSVLPALNVDTIDASDDTLSISLTQYEAIAGTVALTGADDVTVTGSLNFLSTAEIASFATNQVDHLLNNSNLIWTVAQWNALTTAVTIDTVVHFPNGNYVLDSGANLSTVTATQIANFVTEGAEVWYSADPGFVFWNVANLEAMGTSRFDPSTTSVIVDTAANLEAVSDYSIFVSHGISVISASGGSLSLTVAQFAGLGVTAVDGSNTLTIADTAGNLSAYLDGAGVSTALSANSVDFIHATGGTLSVDAQAISNVNGTGAVFTPGDIVTLSDTGAHIAALDFSVLHTLNVDTIDATDNVLNISLGQYDDIKGVVALTVGDDVTVTGNLDSLSTVEIASFATNHVDHLLDDDSFGDVVWSVAQWGALTTAVTIDSVAHDGRNFVADNAAHLDAVTATQIADFVTEGAEVWALSSGTVTWDVAKLEAMGASHWSIASTVTISDTAANLEAVSDFSIFAAHGIDMIDSTDNTLSLTVAQFSGLGTTTLTGADVVTLADTASDLAAYLDGNDANSALAINGVDFIHPTGGSISVDAQALAHLDGTGTVFATGDAVTFADTGANIAAFDFTQLAGLNVDTIHATDNVLSISLDQYDDIKGVVALTPADSVTVTGNLDDLSTVEIAGFGTNGVDHLLDNDGFSEVIWNVSQWDALATDVTIDNVSHIPGLNFVFDSAANLSAVTATQVANFVAEGAQTWEESPAGDDTLVTWTVANTQAMGGSAFSDGTHVTVVDSATNIEAVSDFSIFAAHHIDSIDSTDDTLSLTAAQFGGLGTTTLTGSDDVTLADTAINLVTYLAGSGVGTALAANGVDTIHATGGTIGVSAADIDNVAGSGAVFASGDTVAFSDTGAHIAATDFTVLAGLNVDLIDATDNTLSISLAQYNDIAGVVALTVADNVTVTGNVDDLSTVDIAAFATNHVDHVLDTDGFNEVIWNVGQWDALTTAVTIDNAAHLSFLNVVFDSGANLSAVTTTQIANFVTEGAEVFEGQPPGQESVSWNVAQLQAMGSAVWASTTVTIYDTGAALQAVSDFNIFQNHGITAISATDGSLTLTAAQFGGLGSVTVDAADIFTVSDTAANIEAMGADGYAAMASAGVDLIHATGGSLTVTYDEFSAIASSSTAFVSADTVALTGTQAQLFDAHTASYFSALGSAFHVDEISLTGTGIGHLAVDQWNALVSGGATLDEDNVITLLDTGGNLADETASDIEGMDDVIDHWEVSDGQTLVLSKAQLDALIDVSITFTPTSAVILFSDTEATVEGLTATQLEGYITEGVNAFRASDTSTLNLSVSQVTAVVDNGAYFVPANTVALVDTAAAIGGLSATQYGELVTGFVDTITATDGTLQMSVADFEAIKTALHNGALTLTNAAQLADAGTTISALTTTELGQLSGDNITSISATGDVTFTQAQITALGGGVTVTASGHFILADSEANIEALTTATIDNDAAAGLTTIHATDVSGTLHFTASQAQHILSDGLSVNNTTVTVTDTGAHLSTLSFAQLNGMSTAGFTSIVDTSGTITWSVSQLNHLTVPLTLNGNGLILSDAEATFEAQNAAEWAYIASLATSITASNTHTLNLSVAQIGQLFGSGATFATGDTVTLTDTSTNINALTTVQIGLLSAVHVDAINASDDSITWTVAQFGALNGVTLTAGDNVTLADSGANLETLNFSALAAANVDHIDATDGALTLSVAQYAALGTVTLTAADTVTISDTAANITTLDFSLLAAHNVDVLDVTDGFSLNVARYQSMGAVKFAPSDTITLADTGANLAAMSAVQFAALAGNGIDKIDATDNVLSLTIGRYDALGTVTLTASDVVTLADTGAHIAALTVTQIGTLAAGGIDKIDATDNAYSLTVAQYEALGTVTLTAADTVTLADTGGHIQALTAAQIGALAGNGIDKIDASNNALSLSVAQYGALGTVTLTGADSVTLLDTGANLETLNFSTLASKNVDILDASDNVLALTAAQFQALGTVALKSSDTVTLLDTGADISALTVGQFNTLAAKGIDIIDATDNVYSLSTAQVNGLGALTLAANDTVTMSDTEANIESETSGNFTTAAAVGIDFIHSTNNIDHITVAQVTPLLGTTTAFTAGDTVTLIDTGANIATLTATQIGQLAAAGVDKIDATDNTVTLTVAQYRALGTVTLASGDTNTISDNDTNIDSLTTGELAGLAAAHVGAIHSSFTVVWSAAQWNALPGSVHVSSVFGASGVELIGSADVINVLTAAQISSYAAEGLGALQGFNGDLTLSVSQATAILANLIIVGNDDGIFLTDAGSAIAGLSTTQIGELAGAGFQTINATDDALTLSVAQFQALGAVALTAGDTVTVSDTEAHIEALTNAQLTSMVSNQVDIIHSTGGVLNVTVGQAEALLGSGTHFAYGDAVTLFDSGATISTLGSVQFSALAAAGIDTINASDDLLTLSLAQYRALGTVTLTQSDTVTIQDGNSILNLMTEAEIQSLSSKGIDVLESTNGNFAFNVGQAEALIFQTGGGHVSLSGGDTFYVSDTGADISTLTAANLAALGALGAGSVDLVGSGTITFSVAQYEAAVTAGVLIDSSDNVTLFDTGAALGALTAAQIGALAGNGVDHIDASDDAVTWSLAQVNALGTVTLTAADTYTLSDTEANIEALSAVQFIALLDTGIDVFHSQSGSLSLSESQVAVILGGALLDSANSVTLSDTGGHIAAFSAAQIATLAGVGVDFIDASDNTLTLSVAQYQALGTVQLSAGDANTLSDTSTAFQGLSTTDIAGLDNQYISHLHSSDGVQWSLAQWNALASGITIDTTTGAVALNDTEAHDESLSVTQINNFHTAGLNSIVVSDTSTLDFTVAQTTAILNDGIVLSTGTGVVADSRANLAALTVVQIGELAAAGFHAIDSTNNLVNFNRAQVDALAAGHIALTFGDTVDMNVNEAQLEAFTAATFTAYITQGVDIFQSASSTLAVNESQVVAVMSGGASFRDGDAVTLADTASHIESLKATEFGKLATTGVDIIDVTSGTLSLSVADYLALGAFTIVGGSVALADTSTNIDSLTADQLAALTGTSISHIDASDNMLSLSVADVRGVLTQTNGGTVTFDATDALKVADTGANLGGLTAADLTALASDGAGTVTLDASDDVLTISQAQYDAIVSGAIALTAADTVTLADTGADLAALSAAQLSALATNNVDAIDATDNAIALSIAQLDALHTANVALTPADTVTLSDTEANIEALTGSQLAGYGTQGVDIFTAADSSTLHLNASQIAGVLGTTAAFAAGNNVSLIDSGANIAALSAVQFGQLASQGIDHIDASDNVLALTAAQYSGLGTTTLTGADTVTLSDTGAHIAGLTAAQFAALAANGIDTIDASDNVLSLSVAQYQGLGTVTLTGTDVVTLADTGAHVSALTSVQIGQLAGKGIDMIDTTNNVLSLSLSQFNALGSVTLANADTDTLADTGANLAAMSAAQFAALAGKGIDKIDATDNVLSLTIGRYNALGTVTLTASDTVTLGDTGAHLGALTAAQIGALASRGIDAIDATDNAITFSLAQYNALGSVHTAANDVITVNGTSGDDLISGTANSDVLNGGTGDDVLVGQGGNDTLSGGAGNNTLSGGAGTDTVDYSWSTSGVTVNLLTGTANNGTGTDTLTSIENVTGSGGNDTITAGTGVNVLSGGNGDDTFVFGPYLTAADHVDGGAGNDTVTLNGDYSAGVTFTATTMVNVETLILAAGHSYTLSTVDATVAPGATMTVDGSALGSLDVLNFTGTHETDGNYIVNGGAAADHISTGSGNDTINGGAGDDVLAPGSGNDTVNAGSGNDTIFMYGNLTAADHIDGGAGVDKVRFSGDYSGGVVLGATTITNVETFQFDTGFNYKITTNDATVASGQVLTVDASALGAGNKLTFDGSAETNGTFNITGGLGGDDLTGGAGADHFIYTSAAQSSSIHYDTIHNLDFISDRIDVTGTITAIDAAVTSGSLSTATFDSDLASDMSGHLGVHHALMFTASSGTLAGDTFLVIDINGVAGYQAGQDIVIELAGHTGSLAVSDFI